MCPNQKMIYSSARSWIFAVVAWFQDCLNFKGQVTVRKAELAVLEMKVNPNKSEIDEVLSDILKGESNINPTASQY